MSIAIWRSTRRLSSLSPSLVSRPHQLNAPHHFHHSKLNIYNYQFQPHSFYLRAVPLTFQSASFSTNSVPPPPPSTAAGFFSRWQTISDFTPPSASSASTTSNSEEDKSQKETLDTEPKIGFSRLFQVASRERSLLTLALTAQLVSASSMLVFPLALGNVVDAVTGSSPTDLSSLITIMGVIFGLSGIATATRVSSLSLAGSNISRDLRVRLYSSILKQDTTYFDKINSNKLINRLSNDVPLVSRTLTENLSKILRSSVTTITSLGLIVYLSPKLSLITMLSIPPIGISALFFGKNAKKLSKQLTDALATATQVANERILNIKTLRLFGAEVLESKHYSRKVDETLQIAKSVAFADGIYAGSIQLAAQLSLLGVLWFGGKMVLNPLDPMTIGSLTSFSMYAVNLGVSISSIGTAYGHLSRALGSAYRIFEIIDRQPEGPSSTVSKEVEEKLKYDLRLSDRNEYINESKSTKDISDSGIILDDDYDATVKFENVKFTYPSRPDIQILKGISLTIHPGEILAVAGSSGSGKSTLSSLLSRLYEPTSGNITLNDTPVTSINTSWLRNQISVVSQEPVLFSGTIAENIAYNYDVKNRAEIEDIAKIAASHDMIMGLPNGYDTFVTNTTLSGGQRARIALCRALIRNPKILLLDEHAASLDSKSERAVAQAVTYAAKELGIAVVSIAHRSSTLRKADRVAVVVDGKVAELDSFNQLMSDEGSYLRRMLKPVAKSKLTPQSASSFSTDQAQQD